MESWAHQVSCKVQREASLTLQETRDVHGSMNRPKTEFNSQINRGFYMYKSAHFF